jgi:hypothetical protein
MPRARDQATDGGRAVGAALVGAWSLVECAEIVRDGSKRLPFGARAWGQVVYTADGRMSAQLVGEDRATFASDDYTTAPAEVAAAWFQQYFGYFGRYAVDAGAGTVTHFIEGAAFPNLENKAQVRTFRLEGEHLVLEAATPWGFIRNTWIRAAVRS